MQFLLAVSHSVGAHTESLQTRHDSSSSSSSSEDKDEDDRGRGQSQSGACSDDVSGVAIRSSGSRINHRQQTAVQCASWQTTRVRVSHWCRVDTHASVPIKLKVE